MGLAGGMNLYGFAAGDPVNFSDPFGLCANPTAMGLGSLQCVLEDAIAGAKAAFGRAKQRVADHLAESGRRAAACFSNAVCAVLSFSGGEGEIGGDFAAGRLAGHFEKHAAEFGFKSEAEYLAGANALIKGGEGVETSVRANGDKLFYREATNEFGVLAGDGKTIRTYFKPTDGKAYWLDQIKK